MLCRFCMPQIGKINDIKIINIKIINIKYIDTLPETMCIVGTPVSGI